MSLLKSIPKVDKFILNKEFNDLSLTIRSDKAKRVTECISLSSSTTRIFHIPVVFCTVDGQSSDKKISSSFSYLFKLIDSPPNTKPS